jgi:signal transduction histidine kinase
MSALRPGEARSEAVDPELRGGDPMRLFRGSLVAQLTLLVGLTLAALIAMHLAVGFSFGREVLRKEIDEHLRSVSSSRQDAVQAHLSQLKLRAELMADHGEFRAFFHHLKTGQPDSVNRKYSQSLLNDMTDHRTIFSASLADDTGRVLLANDGAKTGAELAGDPAFEHGLAGPYVGPPRAGGDHFEVTLSAPIRSYDLPPKNIAVLLMTVDASALAAAVRDTTGLGQTGEVLLGIREGDNVRILFPPRREKEAMVIPLAKAPAMAAALQGREFLGAIRDHRGREVLTAAQPVGYGGWGLVTKMDLDEAYAPIAQALRYGLLGGGAVAAVGLAAAYLLARGIAFPVLRLVQAASRVAGGDYETRVPIRSRDEFATLSTRFNEMTAAIRSRKSERDAKEAEIRQLNAELERRVEERTADLDSFSYTVSHDLRAPLRAVNGYARMLVERYGERLDDEGRRLAGVIGQEGQRMGRLIDALLAFSRLGRQSISAARVDMTALAREAFAEAAAGAGERRIDFELGELPSAEGDRTLLRQVFVNLLSNAVKFTRQRDLAVIEVGGRREETETIYWVRDNGAGFDPSHADQLFGVFQRLHRQDEFEGTGVGLAFAQRITHRHRGRIWGDGRPGEGATFHFTLPREDDE